MTRDPYFDVCNRCHITKPLTAFVHNRAQPLGYGYICRECAVLDTHERTIRRRLRERGPASMRSEIARDLRVARLKSRILKELG